MTFDLRPSTCVPRPSTCDPRPSTSDPLSSTSHPRQLPKLLYLGQVCPIYMQVGDTFIIMPYIKAYMEVLFHLACNENFVGKCSCPLIRELKQATFLSTRTSTGSKPRRYRWRMMNVLV